MSHRSSNPHGDFRSSAHFRCLREAVLPLAGLMQTNHGRARDLQNRLVRAVGACLQAIPSLQSRAGSLLQLHASGLGAWRDASPTDSQALVSSLLPHAIRFSSH